MEMDCDADEEKPFVSNVPLSQQILVTNIKSENDLYRHEVNADRFFCCELCLVWFMDLNELLIHISDEHDYKISEEIQCQLYIQWNEVLKIEKTILHLLAVKKFNSAKRALKNYLPALSNTSTCLFNSETNIFKNFIESLQTRLKLLIKDGKINTANELKTTDIELQEHFNTNKNKEKKTSKKRRKGDNNVNFLSDFSSEDEICLKDTIKNMGQDISGNIKIEDTSMDSDDDSHQPEEMTYYVVPEREDGKMISLHEKYSFQTTLTDVLKNKLVNPDLLNGIILRRFNLELDEVVPEEAVIVKDWKLPGTKYESWSTVSFHEFLYKNISEKTKNDISSSDNPQNDSDDEELSMDDSKIGESLEVKLEENSNELNVTNMDGVIFSNNREDTALKQDNSDFKCQTCGIIFMYKGKLLQHELRFHSKKIENRPNTYNKIKVNKDSSDAPECNICFRKFTSLGRLTQHMDIAHGGKAFLKNGRKKNMSLESLDHDDIVNTMNE